MNEGHRIFSQLLRRAKTRHIQINPTLLTNLQYEIKIPTNQLPAFAILRLHTPSPECVLQVDAGMWCDWRHHMTATSKDGALIFGSATNRLQRWSFFHNDGMVMFFFQGTIVIDGFSMVLPSLDHHH